MDPVPAPVTSVDVRDVPVADLEQTLIKSLAECSTACLWTACRPNKNWFRGLTQFHPLVLASSARFEQILWLPPDARPEVPTEWTRECRNLLCGYPDLFSGADLNTYRDAVIGHIAVQEAKIFPNLLQYVPEAQRALRELSYEHRGLENGLKRLPAHLEQHRTGILDSRARERFDLDFYHLLEHNIERKIEAVFPALAYFLN